MGAAASLQVTCCYVLNEPLLSVVCRQSMGFSCISATDAWLCSPCTPEASAFEGMELRAGEMDHIPDVGALTTDLLDEEGVVTHFIHQ